MQNRIYKKIATLLFYPLLFLAIIWTVLLVEQFFDLDLGKYGIYPREWFGLRGIVFSPFLHGDASHAFNNSVLILVVMTLIQMFYRKIAFSVYIWSFLITGFLVWVFARPSYHIGASGIVYAFVFFVFFSGFFSKDIHFIAVSLIISLLFGSLIWGLFFLEEGISWESHFIGGIVGICLAYRYRFKFKESKNLDDFSEDISLPYWTFGICLSYRYRFPLKKPTNFSNDTVPYWKHGQEIHLPNFKLDPLSNISRLAIHYGILDFRTATQKVSALPYGHIKEKCKFESILTENKGTCSSKNAFLYELAKGNKRTDIYLMMGIYQMNEQNTEGVGVVLSKYGLDYLPESYVYLKHERWRLDFTFPNSLSLFEHSLMEEKQIQSDQIGSYKVSAHQEFLKQWKRELNLDYSLEELWQIREQCIQALESILHPV